MDFKDLQRANETIKTTDIGKGKEYAEVNQRIKAFRMLHPLGLIKTELASLVDGVCVFRAEIFTEDGNLLGTGTAYEKEGSSFINKTSFIENCETSAVGRALAMCGFGIDTSIASYEEVMNAKANQGEEMKPLPQINDKATLKEPKKVEKAIKELDKKFEEQKKPEEVGYPPMEELLKFGYKRYPRGSKPLADLLNYWGIEKLEDASQAQLMVIWSKNHGA